MKKSTFPILIAALFLNAVLFPGKIFAQKEQGQSVVSAGVGYSLVGIIFSTLKNAVNTAPTSKVSSTSIPVIAVGYDYGISDKFSIGGAYTYQDLKIKYDSYQDTTTGQIFYGDYYNKLSRQNFGVRMLFHFSNNESLDLYSGLRLGYSMWSHQTNNPSMKSGNSLDDAFFRNRIWPQAIFGMRYFFGDMLGINTEFAIGPTYFIMVGAALRF